MKTKSKIIIALIAITILLAWAPWVTEDYAINKVLDHFTKNPPPTNEYGEVQSGDFMDIDGVKGVTKGDFGIPQKWLPFGKFVTNPEGGFFVTFWGGIL